MIKTNVLDVNRNNSLTLLKRLNEVHDQNRFTVNRSHCAGTKI